jgi:hypothetical protein
MKRRIIALVAAIALLVFVAIPAYAATTADVTVTATPSGIAIADNATSYDFGTVETSSTTNTTTTYVLITNTSSIQTDITIATTTENWTGGTEWVQSDTATPGADTAGMNANRGGTWGTGEIIVESPGTPQYIYENCPATTNFEYGLSLLAPTSYSDYTQKSIVVRIEAVAG